MAEGALGRARAALARQTSKWRWSAFGSAGEIFLAEGDAESGYGFIAVTQKIRSSDDGESVENDAKANVELAEDIATLRNDTEAALAEARAEGRAEGEAIKARQWLTDAKTGEGGPMIAHTQACTDGPTNRGDPVRIVGDCVLEEYRAGLAAALTMPEDEAGWLWRKAHYAALFAGSVVTSDVAAAHFLAALRARAGLTDETTTRGGP